MSPAVCHVDNTARPQLIRREDNPGYYDILSAYQSITGIPSLVNTSFNMHEEPIVNTAAEAVKAFQQSELAALVLGNLLVPAPALDLSVYEKTGSSVGGEPRISELSCTTKEPSANSISDTCIGLARPDQPISPRQ